MSSMKGTVVISAHPHVRVHTYVSPPDGWLVTTPIVEGPEGLVIFDGQLLNAYAEEVAVYARSLGKPVERIIVSHAHPDHWAGLEILSKAFADATISALPSVRGQIRAGGDMMLTRLKGIFGDRIPTRVTVPTENLELGEHTIAGVRFDFRELIDVESDTQLFALLPDQKIMMAFDTIYSPTDHVPTLAGHFEHWLAVLDDLKAIGAYDEIVIGHNAPTDRAAIDATIAYLRQAMEIHASAKDAASYAADLKAAFPNRAQSGWVDLSASLLYTVSPPSATESPSVRTPGQLAYEVFISDPIPFNEVEKAPNGDPRMFQPISSTLIFGDTDAVLVDPPMTFDQTERVAQWIERRGKRLVHIFITHGHGDHWFGTGPLLRRFPGASVLASPGTIEVMRYHASPEVRTQVWDKSFPGQIPETPVLATTPPGHTFDPEGNELRIIEVGHSDTDKTTVLHVPSIGLVVAGDVVYNGVHQYLAEATNGGLRAWMKGLDIVAALRPRHVVAGHKNKALQDDPKTIDETRRYLEDAERLVSSSHTAREFYDAMLTLYPDRLNPSALWFWSARGLFPQG